jgi:hypothetical protein
MSSFLGYNYTAYCSYEKVIAMEFLTIEKLSDGNFLRVVVRIEQFLEKFWEDHRSFGEYVRLNVSTVSVRANLLNGWSFNNGRILTERRGESEREAWAKSPRLLSSSRVGTFEDGEAAEVVFEYAESIHGQDIDLTLDFSSSRDPRLSAAPPSSVALAAVPENRHWALAYPPETY